MQKLSFTPASISYDVGDGVQLSAKKKTRKIPKNQSGQTNVLFERSIQDIQERGKFYDS